MNNTIIECREKNGTTFNNGDYETKLSTPYTLMNNSSITISNAFIDTETQTDSKIEIEKDITLELNMFLYNTNWFNTSDVGFDVASYKDDGADYVVCNSAKFSDPATNGFVDVTSLLFRGDDDDPSIREDWGGTTVQLKYFGLGGEAVAFIPIPSLVMFRGEGASYVASGLNITCKIGHYSAIPSAVAGATFIVQNPDDLSKNRIDKSIEIQSQSVPPKAEDLEPFIYTKKIDINKGQYLPEELNEIINNSMGENENKNKNFDIKDTVDTPFLQESNKLVQTTTTKNTVLNEIILTQNSKEVVLKYSKLQEFSSGQAITLSNIQSSAIGSFNINSLNGNHTITSFQQNAGNLGGIINLNLASNFTQATTTKRISNHIKTINLISGNGNMEVILEGPDTSLSNGDTIQIIGLTGTHSNINFDTLITGANKTILSLNGTKSAFQVAIGGTPTSAYTQNITIEEDIIITNPASATKPDIQSVNQTFDFRFLMKMTGITLASDGSGNYNGLRYKTFTGGNYWVGSNQLELAFDDNTDLFYFKFLHMPMYMPSTSQIISKINKMSEIPTPSNPYYHNGKNGGVVFNSLVAYDRTDTTNIYNFWEAKLGFDTSKICVGYTKFITTLGGRGLRVPIFNNVGDGISATSARPDIDSLISKTSTAFQVVPSDFTAVNSLNSLTTEIFASSVTLESLSLKYSHFLIELQAGYTTTLISENTITKNIQGIVNRYYSIGQFVSGDSGGIVYTHTGEPIYMNSIRVRILDSSKQLASGLGEDSTIFLSVTHPQQ